MDRSFILESGTTAFQLREDQMRNVKMTARVAVGLVAFLMWTGAAFAADLNLAPSNVGFHSPIGIDFQETSGKLILSAEYPSGSPNNLELADPATGVNSVFAPTLVGLTNELKIATVRASPCLASTTFVVGEVFTGNGNPGQIIRINP